MEVFNAILLIGIGIGIDATYNYLRKHGESEACKNGYRQAQNEEVMRREAYEDGERKERVRHMMYESYTTYAPKHVDGENASNTFNIPESFVDHMHNNGRAVARIK